MKSVNNRIIVRVDMKQKNSIIISGVKYFTASPFETNFREKSPVVGEIVEGNKFVRKGQIGIFHHNHFYPPSPYFLRDDLYSVPFNRTLFGVLINDELIPMCGNILCERIEIPTPLPVPYDQRKKYIDRVICTSPGWTIFKKGQLLFHSPNAAYEIVINIGGIEKRIHKIHEEFVVGVVD